MQQTKPEFRWRFRQARIAPERDFERLAALMREESGLTKNGGDAAALP